MGKERFCLYFQYYNVLHELGRGLLRYNNGVSILIVDEEQLANDFAIAYWNYYGESFIVKRLENINCTSLQLFVLYIFTVNNLLLISVILRTSTLE